MAISCRLHYWVFLLVFSGGCSDRAQAPSTNAESADTERPPNIVFILADDLGIGDTGVYGSEIIETPNLDALAAGGVRFTQAYVSHPVCSPSRAGLLTGRYQQRHGWEFNPAASVVNTGMSEHEYTMADAMKAAGYVTGIVGKWHLGHQSPHHPLDRGFDEFYGVLAGGTLFIDPDLPGVESVFVSSASRGAARAIYAGRNEIQVDDYLTDVFTSQAIDFIDRHQEQPFFLYLSHTTPHTPLQATPKYLARYRHIQDKPTRIYAAMVASLDESIGAIVSKLKTTGELDNTLIVFSSDNGCAGYINGACSNEPHAGYKRYHQEGGLRVPLILRWGNRLAAGDVYHHPVSALDLYATFASAAGITARTEDSVDLIPFVTGKKQDAPHDYLYWRSGPTIAIRDRKWKLIRYNLTPLKTSDLNATGRLDPPDGGWPVGSPDGQLTLLYDLTGDPAETENLADRHPDVVERLLAAHETWAADLAPPILPATRSTLATMHGETVQLIF
jgi:arylsulfatase A-like enzyme